MISNKIQLMVRNANYMHIQFELATQISSINISAQESINPPPVNSATPSIVFVLHILP